MAWVKLDDQIPRHHKALKAGPAACWLWVCGIAHCQSQLTDGFISDDVLPMIGVAGGPRVRRLAETLVEVGLFDRAEGGFAVHDYLDHNPSRVDVLAKRAEDAERKRGGDRRSGDDRRGVESTRNPNGIDADSRGPRARVPSVPIRTNPEEQKKEPTSADAAGLRERFAEFWNAYPRKVGKDAAWKSWQKRRPDAELLGKMLLAITWQTRTPEWTKDDGQFVPHPATWLNQGRWQDEPRGKSGVTRWCEHEPTCRTNQEHVLKICNEDRSARGQAPLAESAS